MALTYEELKEELLTDKKKIDLQKCAQCMRGERDLYQKKDALCYFCACNNPSYFTFPKSSKEKKND